MRTLYRYTCSRCHVTRCYKKHRGESFYCPEIHYHGVEAGNDGCSGFMEFQGKRGAAA